MLKADYRRALKKKSINTDYVKKYEERRSDDHHIMQIK
jgi:hypothetical protein